MLLSSGEITAPCGVPCSGTHSWVSSSTLWPRNASTSVQDAAIGHLAGHKGQQAVFRDRVEVALQVGVNHMDVSRLQQFIHTSQRVLTPHARPKAVALCGEVPLVDRFQHHAQCRLDHPVLDGRDSQWTHLLASRLRECSASGSPAGGRFRSAGLRSGVPGSRPDCSRILDGHVIHPRRAVGWPLPRQRPPAAWRWGKACRSGCAICRL